MSTKAWLWVIGVVVFLVSVAASVAAIFGRALGSTTRRAQIQRSGVPQDVVAAQEHTRVAEVDDRLEAHEKPLVDVLDAPDLDARSDAIADLINRG